MNVEYIHTSFKLQYVVTLENVNLFIMFYRLIAKFKLGFGFKIKTNFLNLTDHAL